MGMGVKGGGRGKRDEEVQELRVQEFKGGKEGGTQGAGRAGAEGASRGGKNYVVGLVSGVLEDGKNIFALESGIIFQDLLIGSAVAKQFEDIADTDALAADAGTASAFARFHGNSSESLEVHGDS